MLLLFLYIDIVSHLYFWMFSNMFALCFLKLEIFPAKRGQRDERGSLSVCVVKKQDCSYLFEYYYYIETLEIREGSNYFVLLFFLKSIISFVDVVTVILVDVGPVSGGRRGSIQGQALGFV